MAGTIINQTMIFDFVTHDILSIYKSVSNYQNFDKCICSFVMWFSDNGIESFVTLSFTELILTSQSLFLSPLRFIFLTDCVILPISSIFSLIIEDLGGVFFNTSYWHVCHVKTSSNFCKSGSFLHSLQTNISHGIPPTAPFFLETFGMWEHERLKTPKRSYHLFLNFKMKFFIYQMSCLFNFLSILLLC